MFSRRRVNWHIVSVHWQTLWKQLSQFTGYKKTIRKKCDELTTIIGQKPLSEDLLRRSCLWLFSDIFFFFLHQTCYGYSLAVAYYKLNCFEEALSTLVYILLFVSPSIDLSICKPVLPLISLHSFINMVQAWYISNMKSSALWKRMVLLTLFVLLFLAKFSSPSYSAIRKHLSDFSQEQC